MQTTTKLGPIHVLGGWLLATSACAGDEGTGPAVDTDGGTEAAATETSGGRDDDAGDGTTAPTAGPEDDGGTTGEGDGTTGDDGETDAGTDSGCADDCPAEPHVAWIAEPTDRLQGGACVDVLADGQGGAVASWSTHPDSPLDGGLVLAIDEDGNPGASQALEQRRITGMRRTAPGAFRWVDSYADAGETTTALADLDGEWFADDLVALDDLTPLGSGGYAYAGVVNGLFPECRIRIDTGVFLDSGGLPCGVYGDLWRLHTADDGSVVAGLTGQSALARVSATGQMLGWIEGRFQRTMLDLAVDPQGRVWTVGIVRDPQAAGPSYGSFVARHDPDLAERPQWEVVEDGDASLAWTSIVMWQGAPILVGRDADAEPRLLGLTASGDMAWELPIDLPPSVVLRRADVDDEGRLMLCGDAIDGDAPTAASSPIVVRVDL